MSASDNSAATNLVGTGTSERLQHVWATKYTPKSFQIFMSSSTGLSKTPELATLQIYSFQTSVYGLNLAPWDERDSTDTYADSGIDDEVPVLIRTRMCLKHQLIIHVPFTQHVGLAFYAETLPTGKQVRLKSILLKLGRGESTPRHLRIYANHPNIVDFEQAEDTTPHLNVSLLEGETGVIEYPFRVAAFASVTSLSLFFSESVGGDLSRIYYLGFKGDSKSTRQEGLSKLEIPAANAADASLVDRVTEKAAGSQTTAR
ncbi:UPF0424 protein [Mycena kentingensis (nom. inval.)]|nr:UPF0424 protein [Mycena kentingensis (nom. inval.)]